VGTQYEEVHRAPIPSNPALSKNWTQSSVSENEPTVLIRGLSQPISTITRGIKTGYVNVAGTPAMHPFQPINMMAHHQISQPTALPKALDFEYTTARSLKSASSVESFQSAVSVQRSLHEPVPENGVQQQLEAVHGVLHAFRTALEVLSKLMDKRLLAKKQDLYPTAKQLERSLTDGEKEFKDAHGRRCKIHGDQYIQAFTESRKYYSNCLFKVLTSLDNTTLHDVASTLWKDVVMPLHMYSADHVIINRNDFEALRACSERCQVQAVLVIVDIASTFSNSHPEINIQSGSAFVNAEIASEPRGALQSPDPTIRYSSPSISRPLLQNFADSETSLPSLGYTFKRSDNSFRGTNTQQTPNRRSLKNSDTARFVVATPQPDASDKRLPGITHRLFGQVSSVRSICLPFRIT
jgi:hypothetical protein